MIAGLWNTKPRAIKARLLARRPTFLILHLISIRLIETNSFADSGSYRYDGQPVGARLQGQPLARELGQNRNITETSDLSIIAQLGWYVVPSEVKIMAKSPMVVTLIPL